MNRPRLWILVVTLCTVSTSLASQSRQPDMQERDKLFAWFDSLGTEPIRKGEFVEFFGSALSPFTDGGDRYGFITRTSEGIEVVSSNLRVFTLPREKVGESRRPLFRHRDFREWAEAQLTYHPKFGIEGQFGTLSGRARTFLVSNACAARGLGNLSRKFFDLSKIQENDYPSEGLPSFSGKVKFDVASRLYEGLIERFSDPKVSRPQLLKELEFTKLIFPVGSEPEDLKENLRRMQRMAAEDRVHPKVSTQQLFKLPVAKRIAEFIYRLRDQMGPTPDISEYLEFLPDGDSTHGHPSPAAELVSIGFPAVPYLIAKFDDQTLTRGVYRQSHGGRLAIATVAGACRSVLQSITGIAYGLGNKEAAMKWWSDHRNQSEFQFLAEELANPKHSYVMGVADILARHFPDKALPLIIKSLSFEGGNYESQIIPTIRHIRTGEAREYARRRMTESSDVAAAGVYSTWDSDAATRAMIKDFRHTLQSNDPRKAVDFIGFLVESGRPEAFKVVAEGAKGDLDRKGTILWSLIGRMERPMLMQTFFGSKPKSNSDRHHFEELAQDYLGRELQDKSKLKGNIGFDSTDYYSDLRLCDLAGHALDVNWPDRYQFEMVQPIKDRDSQLAKCLEAWKHRPPAR